MKLSYVLRALAGILGVGIIGFAVYATPIVWREEATRWFVVLLWPLAVGGIRLLRVSVVGKGEALRRADRRQEELRAHRERYHNTR